MESEDLSWELVSKQHRTNVRRLAVSGGWLYQVQDSLKYSTAPGTIGREHDNGTPTWFAPIFVPSRALDLTAEEVKALRDLLNYLGPRVLREWKTTAPGMAVLDKLLSHESSNTRQRGDG